jgi:outer membrane biosynthesis protein TonB
MLQVTPGDAPSRIDMPPAASENVSRMRWSLVGSFALHGLVILLVVASWLWLSEAPPPAEHAVTVDLVRLSDKTASPSATVTAPLPQEQAAEKSASQPIVAVPVPQTPPPPTAREVARETAMSASPAVLKPEGKPTVASGATTAKPEPPPITKLKRPPSPVEELNARLTLLAQLRQPATPMPPDPRQQSGSGLSNLTATSANADRAGDATYKVKDFIRAQVERRWNPDSSILKPGNWVVNIHIMIQPNGNVSRAEIVDDPRFSSDSAYRDFAYSARNAVLLSSPLTIPPDEYDIAKDITVDFDPKQVLR